MPSAGADRALGVVLVGHRRAEERHHVVADVLVDRAAEALHLLAQPPQRAVHQRLDRLGVHALGHGGVAGQVGEQHGHLAALLGRCASAPRRAPGRVPSSAAPQDMQKRASAGAGVPQAGQRRSSALPAGHAEARASGVLGAAGCAVMPLSLRHHPGVAVGLRRPPRAGPSTSVRSRPSTSIIAPGGAGTRTRAACGRGRRRAHARAAPRTPLAPT